jgi:hypothetical protein
MEYSYGQEVERALNEGASILWTSNDGQGNGGVSFAPSLIVEFPDGSREYIASSFSTTEEAYVALPR